MVKQYGIDSRLVIWIRKNTGHDLQTFSDLAKIKCLDSRRRNYSAKEKIEDLRLPSWLVLKENDFSLIGEMAKLKQLTLHDVAIDDYSFLTQCKSLSTLDLQDTSFSDCRLLTELPALKKVFSACLQPAETYGGAGTVILSERDKGRKGRRARAFLFMGRSLCIG